MTDKLTKDLNKLTLNDRKNAKHVAGKPAKKGGKKKKSKNTTQPSRNKTPLNQGIYISPSRTKWWLDSNGINKEIEDALHEIRELEPHDIETEDPKTKTKKVTRTKLKKLDQLSEKSRRLLDIARDQYDERETAKKAKAEADAKDPEKVKKAKKAKEAKEAKDAKNNKGKEKVEEKKPTPYALQKEQLTKIRTRFSHDAAPQAAATACLFMHDLIEFGMKNVIKQDLKILKRRHVIEAGFEKLETSCLYKNLPVWKKAIEEEAERDAKEEQKRLEKKAARKEEKEKEKVAEKDTTIKDKHHAKAKPAKEEEDDADAEDDDHHDEDDEDDERNFRHYIRQVCHDIMNTKYQEDPKSGAKYTEIRISKEIREFGSNLLINWIKSLCPLLRSQITTNGVKTVTDGTVKQCINTYFMINNLEYDSINKELDKKLKLYAAYCEKKKKEKAAEDAAKEAEEKKQHSDKKHKANGDADADAEESGNESEAEADADEEDTEVESDAEEASAKDKKNKK